ncbi:uncharacterized protein PAC_15168 [Phialocephala subalpina]|uniref:C2H2-type domain-containing protein n=1 Tax=Phialocephala subalpina TaxID=576137 RepID=A0A1L7XJT0_9HELO|nr:uncharacterized protein PAC_15168 [Phialocephala subalpina]
MKQHNTAELAVTAQAQGQAWGRWPKQHSHQPIYAYYTTDISGIIQSYDSKATSSSTALTRTIMAPYHYIPAHPYSEIPTNTIISTYQRVQHHHPFGFDSYSGPNPDGMIPAFTNNFIQQRPLPQLKAPNGDKGPGMSFSPTTQQGFVEEHLSHSPPIKTEPLWTVPNNSPTFVPTNNKTVTPNTPSSAAKPPQTPSPVGQSRYQKTHLNIHERAHTGVKPYRQAADEASHNSAISRYGHEKISQNASGEN